MLDVFIKACIHPFSTVLVPEPVPDLEPFSAFQNKQIKKDSQLAS